MKLFSNDFTIYKMSDIYGTIHKTVIEKALNDVSPTGTNGDAVLLLGDQKGAYASSAMYVDGKYYIFDTHSQSMTSGLPSEYGSSVLLEFDILCLCKLCHSDCKHSSCSAIHCVENYSRPCLVYQTGNKVVPFKMITP